MNPLIELDALLNLFPQDEPLINSAEHVPSSQTPEPYKQMLVHDHHMTVTMESYHQTNVDVVQFGIVRFNFQYVTDEVRAEILAGETPLGRVLINHNVLRHIDLGAILRITAGPGLARLLQMPEGETTYGRMATIFCNHQPAVDLLEISAPLTA